MSQLKFPKATIKLGWLYSPAWIKKRLILWLILGITAFGMSGLIFAKVEPAVYLTGQLKTEETVKRLQLPPDTVIHEIYVKQGEQVQKGHPLLSFYVTNYLTKLKNLESFQRSLREKNQFYQSVINQTIDAAKAEEAIARLKLSQDKISLVKNKIDLIEENKRLKTQVIQEKNQVALKIKQLENLESKNLVNSSSQALFPKERLEKQIEQIKRQLYVSENLLNEEQKRLDLIENLVSEKAVSYLQYTEQQEKIKARKNEINKLLLDLQSLQLVYQPKKESHKSTINKNKESIINQISNQQEKIILIQKQIIHTTEKNDQIEKQLKQFILENKNEIKEINEQIQQYSQNLKIDKLNSPISGKVKQLNLINEDDYYWQIIPEQKLFAQVFIPYKNSSLIQEKKEVEVIIDGLEQKNNLPGKIVFIGADILPPSKAYPFYRLSVDISLEKNRITSNHKEIVLKSDMAVTVKFPIAQKQSILEFFYNNILFTIHQIQSKGGV